MDRGTIEGLWEEVTRHADQLVGRRVRVTVLDDPAPPESGTRPPDPILGIFNDAPDLLDEVVEEAMIIREERPWRLPAGE
ncbi:hypothetical protein [Paludisphaera sp.]|uniref:hypothetical protein n=1 Tax=Paludisphaera sp. TaxID=2017432 RepID=UPI00301B7241